MPKSGSRSGSGSGPEGFEAWIRKGQGEASPEVRALRRENRLLLSRITELEGGTATIVRAVREAYRDPPDFILPTAPRLSSRRDRETAVLHLSDLHGGKKTKSYGMAVLRDRLRRLGQAVVEITELRRRAARVDELVLLAGGDLVEGEDIFPGQPFAVDQPLFDQAVRGVPSALASLILYLLASFRRIRVYAVAGNHGRATGGKHATVHPRTNWDLVACEVARLMLLGPEEGEPRLPESRLTWSQPDDFYAVAPVCGDWRIFLTHGSDIPVYNTFPWYSVARKINEYAQLEAFDALFLGHFHTYAGPVQMGGRTMCANGTTVSDDPYSRQKFGGGGSPCQRLCFWNEKHGMLADAQIHVEAHRVPELRRYAGQKR